MIKTVFNAKVLLFGEYAVVVNGQGLSVPYGVFNGYLTLPTPKQQVDESVNASQKSVQLFFDYIFALPLKNRANMHFNEQAMKKALQQGLFFAANIPQAYGLGSSGALIAAVYNQFVQNKIPNTSELNNTNLQLLRTQFACLEAYFHGKSSGTDPLICYLNKAVLINQTGLKVLPWVTKKITEKKYIFLLDSLQERPKKALVPVFLEKLKEKEFKAVCEKELCYYNEQCINAVICNDKKQLMQYAKRLSSLQYQYFRFLIPTTLLPKWEQGWRLNDYYLKVCGSGGGGFMLGVTEKPQKVLEAFGENQIKWVW